MHMVIETMNHRKEWAGKIKTNYTWYTTLKEHPNNIIPAQAKNHKDRWAKQ